MTQTHRRIQQEATHWATKAQLGSLTPEEGAHLQTWLEADARHRGAFIRANVVRVAIERVAALTGGTVPEPLASSSWRARLLFRNTAPGRRLIAASIAALTLASGVWFAYQPSGDRYISDIGELRQVALGDGSSMFLNTATKAVVHLTEQAREVSLAQGEALFDVAKDPSRPFLVRADNITVRAIGTAFAVRNLNGRIDVTVKEGVVELVDSRNASVQRLTADQRAIVVKAQPVMVQVLDALETDRALAWRTGRLEFDGQPLNEAVSEMNRHNRRQIVVADARLAHEPVVGVFRSIDAETFANIAAAALHARVVDDGGVIRIEPRAVQ